MRFKLFFLCSVVSLATCCSPENKTSSSGIVGTTWTREYSSYYTIYNPTQRIEETVHQYILFKSETEAIFTHVGHEGYGHEYQYTLNGSELTFEYVKKLSGFSDRDKAYLFSGTYTGESLLINTVGGSPIVFEKSKAK